jgi:hypothetical protein
MKNNSAKNWGWIVAAGVISILAAMLIALGWPVNSLWVLGMFLAIDLVMQGWAFIAVGLALTLKATFRSSSDNGLTPESNDLASALSRVIWSSKASRPSNFLPDAGNRRTTPGRSGHRDRRQNRTGRFPAAARVLGDGRSAPEAGHAVEQSRPRRNRTA